MKITPREVEQKLHEAGFGEEDFFDPPSKLERRGKPQKRANAPLPWPADWFGEKDTHNH